MSMLILSWCLLGTGTILLGLFLYREDCRATCPSRTSKRGGTNREPEDRLLLIALCLIGCIIVTVVASAAVILTVKSLF